MDNSDIRIETYTSGFSHINMRITHIPTGVYVEGTGKGIVMLRQNLMIELENKLSQTICKPNIPYKETHS